MIDVPYLLRDLVDCRFDLQEWINKRFWDPDIALMHKNDIEYFVTKDGLKFLPICTNEISAVPNEVQLSDLTSEDIVLDLGANVGGFAIRAARIAKHVYAVEPLFVETLKKNIELNDMQGKITIIPVAVGSGEKITIQYGNKPPQIVKTSPFPQILDMLWEKVTFLKVDIEGAEWGIYPGDLKGIKRIEFEAHHGKTSCMPEDPAITEYLKKNYNCIVQDEFLFRSHIHATLKEGSQ
jgi:FkbM family methyltransferase